MGVLLFSIPFLMSDLFKFNFNAHMHIPISCYNYKGHLRVTGSITALFLHKIIYRVIRRSIHLSVEGRPMSFASRLFEDGDFARKN